MSTYTDPTAAQRRQILTDTRSVTIVGASDNPARPSNFVATYLLAATDYTVHFVNPKLTTLFGRPVYPSLADLPERPDLVSVFRRPEDLYAVAEEVVAAGARTLWFQLGLRDERAAEYATDHGLTVVMNRCVKIEHARFAGGLHLAGFDTGVISSRRHTHLT